MIQVCQGTVPWQARDCPLAGTKGHITFSANPMWPWLFGNTVLSIDSKGGASADMDLGNKKPVKRNPGSDSCKVDPVQCIVMGIGLLTQYEGQNH